MINQERIRRLQRRAEFFDARDDAYRAALGLAAGQPIPSALGMVYGHGRRG